MAMPPIADVKAAAEFAAECERERVDDDLPEELFEFANRSDEVTLYKSAAVLARFALAVLNAPGMNAERLCEVSTTPDFLRREFTDNAGDVQAIGAAADEFEELFAEVLRLRAEKLQ